MNEIKRTVPPRAPRPELKTVRNGSAARPQSAMAVKAQISAAQTKNEKIGSAPGLTVPKMSDIQANKASAAQSQQMSKELQSRIAKSQEKAEKTTDIKKVAVSAEAKQPVAAKTQSHPVPQATKVPGESVKKTVASSTTANTAASSATNVQRIKRAEPEHITSPQMQRRRETVGSHAYEQTETVKNTVKKKAGPFKIIMCALSFMLTFVIILGATVFVCLKMICGETSPAAKELLVTTLLETGQMKDIASWFLTAEEIQQIVDGNKMSSFENDIDSSLISIDKTPAENENGEEQKDIEVVEISGRTFFGTLLIIKDPSRVELSSIYPWAEEGVPLDKLVNDAGAVAGINGGLYSSTNNSGGRPCGVVVCKGEIQLNEPQQYPGLVLVGFTEDNILEIIPVSDYSKTEVENLIRDKKIRDAVTFQEEASDKNNHFVQLVINGEARDMNGMGSGLNPRTAIGQRADGSVLMLVTDGRGKSGHLGASASDLINVMVEYGAVNAANLDGGSSSCMYYNGEYLMTSVTFYYSNSSWKLPLGFVVK